MTTARNNSTPALPGMSSAARDAARSSQRFAKCWTPAECAFIEQVYSAWTAAFQAHGVRANHTRRNHFQCVQLFRFIHGADNTGDAMTEADVLVAIRAYAADPHNREKCGGRWKAIGDWIHDPDNIDKQLARLGKRRGQTAPSQEDRLARARFERALQFLEPSGWKAIIDAMAGRRGGNMETLRDYLTGLRTLAARSNSPAHRQELTRYDRMIAALDAVQELMRSNRPAWVAIHNYALAGLRMLKDSRLKCNLHDALRAELLARYGAEKAAAIAKASAAP